jgi:hypothetical protein
LLWKPDGDSAKEMRHRFDFDESQGNENRRVSNVQSVDEEQPLTATSQAINELQRRVGASLRANAIWDEKCPNWRRSDEKWRGWRPSHDES